MKVEDMLQILWEELRVSGDSWHVEGDMRERSKNRLSVAKWESNKYTKIAFRYYLRFISAFVYLVMCMPIFTLIQI